MQLPSGHGRLPSWARAAWRRPKLEMLVTSLKLASVVVTFTSNQFFIHVDDLTVQHYNWTMQLLVSKSSPITNIWPQTHHHYYILECISPLDMFHSYVIYCIAHVWICIHFNLPCYIFPFRWTRPSSLYACHPLRPTTEIKNVQGRLSNDIPANEPLAKLRLVHNMLFSYFIEENWLFILRKIVKLRKT